MQSTEEWLPVRGYEGMYEVSNLGRVRSLQRAFLRNSHPITVKARILRLGSGKNGYLLAYLCRDGIRWTTTVHSLVIDAFSGPRPTGYDVCHENGDRHDNRAINLRYDTRSGNLLDQRTHGTNVNASKTHCKRGHEFTPENTTARSDGGRECRACVKVRRDESQR
jgi:hypothetical protein